MHKQEIYEKIKRQSAERKLNFQPVERGKGVEFGFIISDNTTTVCGNIMSTAMSGGAIYQGITNDLFNFYDQMGIEILSSSLIL